VAPLRDSTADRGHGPRTPPLSRNLRDSPARRLGGTTFPFGEMPTSPQARGPAPALQRCLARAVLAPERFRGVVAPSAPRSSSTEACSEERALRSDGSGLSRLGSTAVGTAYRQRHGVPGPRRGDRAEGGCWARPLVERCRPLECRRGPGAPRGRASPPACALHLATAARNERTHVRDAASRPTKKRRSTTGCGRGAIGSRRRASSLPLRPPAVRGRRSSPRRPARSWAGGTRGRSPVPAPARSCRS